MSFETTSYASDIKDSLTALLRTLTARRGGLVVVRNASWQSTYPEAGTVNLMQRRLIPALGGLPVATELVCPEITIAPCTTYRLTSDGHIYDAVWGDTKGYMQGICLPTTPPNAFDYIRVLTELTRGVHEVVPS